MEDAVDQRIIMTTEALRSAQDLKGTKIDLADWTR